MGSRKRRRDKNSRRMPATGAVPPNATLSWRQFALATSEIKPRGGQSPPKICPSRSTEPPRRGWSLSSSHQDVAGPRARSHHLAVALSWFVPSARVEIPRAGRDPPLHPRAATGEGEKSEPVGVGAAHLWAGPPIDGVDRDVAAQSRIIRRTGTATAAYVAPSPETSQGVPAPFLISSNEP